MQVLEKPVAAHIQPAIWNRAALGLVAAYALISTYLALHFPLAPDETYYWEWSRRPAWGYYDQGPMIAWWIRTGCILFGDTQIGIRSTILIASALTQLFIFLTARDLFGPRAGFLAVLFSSITPMGLAGGFVATYDPALMLFWSIALYFSQRAIFGEKVGGGLATGLAFGLGLLSKHTMALFVPCLALGIYVAQRPNDPTTQRPSVSWGGPIAALLLGLLIFLPNLIWQSHHDWMTFRHLFLLTGAGAGQNPLRRLGEYVGSQAGLITPLLFIGMIWALIQAWRSGEVRLRFMSAVSLPILVLFALFALKSKVQANWAVCAWPAAAIVYGAWLDRSSLTGLTRRIATASTALCAVISLLLALPEVRAALRIPFPQTWDQMNKLYGGAELGRAVDHERAAMESAGERPVIVGSSTYDQTSRLAFYTQGQPRAYCFFLGTRANSYVLWNQESGLKPGDNAIICDGHAPGKPGFPPYAEVFERIVPAGDVPIYRNPPYTKPVLAYYLYRCYGYRTNAAIEKPKGG